ncbi:hypothetical protein FEM48_Zijuj04G0044500 [Ziziphus jujuba var. spinosa]|uniref:Uncharacterized protein n=1 Tax=Ziziphus jujuba var. spinosa TaxID=714518 RepID=A0A978VHT2_ZIZJJ|nr:hypothetical protein FEM48_Zijuj04G0044500 [Ziziphus jujuba var. spinosa]
MAFLASCWFITETFIIPDGFRKWFCLSFFIHPFFLFVCQVFLWLKLLKEWLLFLVLYPLRITFIFGLYILGIVRNWFIYFLSMVRLRKDHDHEAGVEKFENLQICNYSQIAGFPQILSIFSPVETKMEILAIQSGVFQEEKDDCAEDSVSHEDEDMEEPVIYHDEDTDEMEYLLCYSSPSTEYESSTKCLPACSSESYDSQHDQELYMDDSTPSVYTSSLQIMKSEAVAAEDKDELDAFYKKYTERMRWFDMLNYDRTCGTSAILNKQLGAPSRFESSEPQNSVVPYISWSKNDRRKLLRSLESDFEMVYVAQSCLSWEALHHQYTKAKALESSASQSNKFDKNVAAEFQKFQVLLERFMEDEKPEDKRVWNYVQRRFSFRGLLQVPEVSGTINLDNLKGIYDVMDYDLEKYSLWTYPPVEDPRDLELLADLTKRLQKKKIGLKNLEGKKRCLFKRIVNPVEESQRKEMLFAMTDMKLVSRVLQMVMVSSSQLKWCQEKLDNVQFIDGKVVRAPISSLFPPS